VKKFLILTLFGLLLAGCIVEPGYHGGDGGERHQHFDHW
jgi:hypothetical protein